MDMLKESQMVFDVARVRGLYTSLGDGWTYLSAHAQPQIPERVSSAVARGFRQAPVVEYVEPNTGNHGNHSVAPEMGRLGAESQMKAARQAVADLTGTTANAVILAPRIDVLYQRLDTALRPVLRRGQLLASRADTHQLTNDDIAYAEPDLGTGEVPAWQYTNLVTGDTRLVTLSAVHPQVGTVNDVSQISENVREHSRAWVLVDATALAGFSPITIDDLGVDMVIVDCTAIGAPQVAALAFRDTSMFPRIDMAAFLEDVAPGLVAGLPAAVDHLAGLVEQDHGSRRQRLETSLFEAGLYLRRMADYLADSLSSMTRLHVFGVTGEIAYGSTATRIPRVTFCIPGVPASTIRRRLIDNRLVTTVAKPDPLLSAMGLEDTDGAITVGLGPYNTTHDVDQLIRVLASLA